MDLFWKLMSLIGVEKEGTETIYGNQPTPKPPTPQVPTPTQAPTPTPSVQGYQAPQNSDYVNYDDIENNIRQGLTNYGGSDLPFLNYMPTVMDATKKYDLFRNNPYLIPQLAILETSGGKNVTRPNNLINYGVGSPEISKLFAEVGMEDALRRSLKEMGETGNVYSRFRKDRPLTDDELLDFARTYEPANPDYPQNLLAGYKQFGQK